MTSDISIAAHLKDNISGKLEIIRDNFDRLGGSKGVAEVARGFRFQAASIMANEFVGYAQRAIGFAQESIMKASDLGETVSKVENLFGESAGTIKAWAETAATSFGQSKKQAMDAATQFGGMFSSVGYAMDEATAQSQVMVELGADLASFFNTDMADALHALRSGLGGEAEALRRYNVFISDAAVQSKLFEMGVEKVHGQFSEGQKVMARYRIIMEQTQAAQGDYARTADGLANSQRSITAQMEDLQAEIGEELLPVARDLSVWARDEGVPALQALVDVAKNAGPVFEGLGSSFGGSVHAFNAALGDDDPGEKFEGVVTGMLNALNPFMEAMGNAGRDIGVSIGNALTGWDQKTQASIVAFRDAERATLDLGWAANYAATETGALDGATVQFEGSAGRTSETVEEWTTRMAGLSDEAADAWRAIHDLDTVTQAWFDTIAGNNELDILRGDLVEANAELRKERRRLEELEAIREPTAAQRRDIVRTRGRVAELTEKVDTLKVKIGQLDGASLAELKAQFNALKKNGIDPSTDAMVDLYNLILKTAGIDFTINPSTGKKEHRASGGPVLPGRTYTVGEDGEETLVMGSSGGYVYASGGGGSARSAGGSGGGGAPVTIALNLDGREVARVVDRHLYYEAARAPR